MASLHDNQPEEQGKIQAGWDKEELLIFPGYCKKKKKPFLAMAVSMNMASLHNNMPEQKKYEHTLDSNGK